MVPLAWFEARISPVPGSGCWLWTSAWDRDGYGLLHVGDLNYRAHRVSYALYIGPIPGRLRVCHRCDTPACVNPAHLFLGTDKDNAIDRGQKGREWRPSRRTHCKHGHEYTPENTYLRTVGGWSKRECRACNLAAVKRYCARRSAA